MSNYEDVHNEIFESWNRSIINSLSPYIKYPQISLNNVEFKKIQENEKSLISVFKNCTDDLLSFGNYEDYIFLLFNTDKILLSKVVADKNIPFLENKGIKYGVSYSEESIGVNSISLCSQKEKPVFIDAEQHFCVFLRDVYSCAAPLKLSGSVVGYLNLSTTNKDKKEKLRILVDILPDAIMNKLHVAQCRKYKQKLSQQQLEILTLLANGKTEVQIAKELNYSIQTVKYHKHEIFEKFNVKNTADAITKLYTYNESKCSYK